MPESINYTNGLSNACADLIARGAPCMSTVSSGSGRQAFRYPIMAARDGTKFSGGSRLGRHANQGCLI
jgi:hypothetical protein